MRVSVTVTSRTFHIREYAAWHIPILFPGPNDGTMGAYGVGDLWVLRYHGDELDDGVPDGFVLGTAAETMAYLDDKFVNGELVKDKDVLWYASHFRHDQNHEGGIPRS
jgi:hypothetical protein